MIEWKEMHASLYMYFCLGLKKTNPQRPQSWNCLLTVVSWSLVHYPCGFGLVGWIWQELNAGLDFGLWEVGRGERPEFWIWTSMWFVLYSTKCLYQIIFMNSSTEQRQFIPWPNKSFIHTLSWKEDATSTILRRWLVHLHIRRGYRQMQLHYKIMLLWHLTRHTGLVVASQAASKISSKLSVYPWLKCLENVELKSEMSLMEIFSASFFSSVWCSHCSG